MTHTDPPSRLFYVSYNHTDGYGSIAISSDALRITPSVITDWSRRLEEEYELSNVTILFFRQIAMEYEAHP